MPVQVQGDVPLNLEWKTKAQVSKSTTLKSTRSLSRAKVLRIKRIVRNTHYLFFNVFERDLRGKCGFKPLNILLIEQEVLTSPKYFQFAKPTNFGRYFSYGNMLYIEYGVFKNPEWLAHEMAHYYYDVCGIMFKNINAEHEKVYDFQHLYEEWIRK